MYEVLLIGILTGIGHVIDCNKRTKLVAKRMYKGGAI